MEAGSCRLLASLVVIVIAGSSSLSWKYYWTVWSISYVEKVAKEDVTLTERARLGYFPSWYIVLNLLVARTVRRLQKWIKLANKRFVSKLENIFDKTQFLFVTESSQWSINGNSSVSRRGRVKDSPAVIMISSQILNTCPLKMGQKTGYLLLSLLFSRELQVVWNKIKPKEKGKTKQESIKLAK